MNLNQQTTIGIGTRFTFPSGMISRGVANTTYRATRKMRRGQPQQSQVFPTMKQALAWLEEK